MSVWRDIREKSLGHEKRVEDTWNKDLWPEVSKVFSKTIAHDLVPVQPMAPPTGGLFYFDPKTAKKVTKAGKKAMKKMTKQYERNNQKPWGIHQLS